MFKLIFLALFFYGMIVSSVQTRYEKPIVEPKIYPLKEQKRFSLGFNDIMADLYWLRVIQNIDYCENANYGRKSSNPGLGMDEILSANLRNSRCHKGWVYQMLNLVTDLAPKFRKVYRVGGELLSVAVDDREGARLIFDKGIKQFPAYWELLYSASYHYLFEYQNPEKAADLLIQAAENGGPFWFRQMAGTLYTKAGRFVMAEVTLRSYVENYEGKRGVEQAKKRLEELQVAKQKEKERVRKIKEK